MIWMVIGYVKTYLDKCKRDNIGAFAAQAAFFIIMSAIPFLMVFTSLLQYTNISQEYVTDLLCKAMPKYIEPLLQPILNEVYSRSVGIISLTAIVALWAAGKALQYMTAGMNVLNGIDETRNWFVRSFLGDCLYDRIYFCHYHRADPHGIYGIYPEPFRSGVWCLGHTGSHCQCPPADPRAGGLCHTDRTFCLALYDPAK